MIVVRNEFRLKFGMAREARALWVEGKSIIEAVPGHPATRVMVDVSGPNYTWVIENTFASLTAFEAEMPVVFGNPAWHAWYQKFAALVEEGHRTIYSVVE